MRTAYQGIKGLEARQPVGAVVTVGLKRENGNVDPASTNRFYIMSPTPQGPRLIREKHPEFAGFNNTGGGPGELRRRQVIYGNLVHIDLHEGVNWGLRCYKGPRQDSNPPSRRPFCEGDGEKATRYQGLSPDGAEVFEEIRCPNNACEFRQGTEAPCKAASSVVFRIRWPQNDDYPTTICRWTSLSWNSARNLAGFVKQLDDFAEGMGLDNWRAYGLPIKLTLTRKTKPGAGHAFPVVVIEPDCDLVAFFGHQRETIRQMGGSDARLIEGPSLDEEELADRDEDAVNITPGIPAQALVTEEPEAVEDAEILDETDDAPAVSPPLSAQQVQSICTATGATVVEVQQLAAELGNDPAAIEAEIRGRLDV